MSTRKGIRFPIVLTFIIIAIVVYLFATIKQTYVTCDKNRSFDSDIGVSEHVVTSLDGKKITGISITKTIKLPEKYTKDDTRLNSIKMSLEKTLDYLGDKVKYSIGEDRIIVTIKVDKNEIVLLDNIEFIVNDDMEIKINSNTKSNDIVVLKVGDSYTDGELMKKLKNHGYVCK